MTQRIYHSSNEIKKLTEYLASKISESTILAGEIPELLESDDINKKYLEKRSETIQKNNDYKTSAMINNDQVYFTIYNKNKKLPVIIGIEGGLSKRIIDSLGIGPDPDQDACCV